MSIGAYLCPAQSHWLGIKPYTMADAGTAAKARMGKLKKKADRLGVQYQDDVTEDQLKLMIEEATEDEEEHAGGITEASLVKMGAEIGKAIGKANKESEDGGEETFTEPPAEEKGELKCYYTPQFFWILPSKKVAGRLVKAPYKKIVFKLDRGAAIQVGTQWQTRYMSSYHTDNVKEQAHLESHPLFKRIFFVDDKEADITSDQVKFAQRFALHIQNLNLTMAPELYRMAAELGAKVDHSMSLPTLRTNIATKMTENDIAREEAHLRTLLTASGKQDLLTHQAM